MNGSEIDVERLGRLEVFDEAGYLVKLSTLWEKNPALLVFVRHFG